MVDDLLVGAVILAWIAIILLCFAMSGLMRALQQLSVANPTRPPLGSELPRECGLAVSHNRDAQPSVTIFLLADANCTSCVDLVEGLLRNLRSGLSEGAVELVTVARNRAEQLAHANGVTSSVVAPEAFRAFRATALPFYVLVDEDGRILDYGIGDLERLTRAASALARR